MKLAVAMFYQSRPLLRSKESHNAVIENNRLTNVSEADRYTSDGRARPIGLEETLSFECGVQSEFVLDGWKTWQK